MKDIIDKTKSPTFTSKEPNCELINYKICPHVWGRTKEDCKDCLTETKNFLSKVLKSVNKELKKL